jgi:hypothetical protein
MSELHGSAGVAGSGVSMASAHLVYIDHGGQQGDEGISV